MASETHTFLFTDLEGSTALWERDPTAMGPALTRHDEILLDAITAHHGELVKSTGDGVHAVFPSARDGVAAAIAAQRGLADTEWPGDLTLKVRMGVHLGDATRPRRRLVRHGGEPRGTGDGRRERRPGGVHARCRGARA